MTSYIPEQYYGHIPGTYPMQYGLLPWPEHLKPQQAEPPLPDIDLPTLFGDPSGVELTKKGEAYAEKALAEAGGVFFVTLSQDDRAGIATTIERLIGLLDALDGDENLEEGADDEPSLDGLETAQAPFLPIRAMTVRKNARTKAHRMTASILLAGRMKVANPALAVAMATATWRLI